MWKRNERLANQFWQKRRTELLSELNSRQKWIRPQRNLMVGDVVLIKDKNAARCQWEAGTLESVKLSEDGLVRSANVKMASRLLDAKGRNKRPSRQLERSAQELVVLLPVCKKVVTGQELEGSAN